METAQSGKKLQNQLSWLPLMAALLYFVGTIPFISPSGNFPLNDDALYAIAVRDYVDTGVIQIPISMASCFLPQILGGITCSAFGFSHEVLRWQTLAVSFIGIIGFFLALREAGVKRGIAGLLSLIYTINPLFISVSYSFMTDAYSLTAINFYVFFLLKGISKKSNIYLAISAIFFALSLLVRQTNILMLIPNILILPYLFERSKKGTIALICLIALPVISFWFANYAMTAFQTQATEFADFYLYELVFRAKRVFLDPVNGLKDTFYEIAEFGFYAGLLFTPMIFGLIYYCLRKSLKQPVVFILPVITACLITGLVLIKYLKSPYYLMPFNVNIWWLPALGPPSILGYTIEMYSPKIREIITLMAGINAFFLTLFSVRFFQLVLARLQSWSGKRLSEYSKTKLCVLVFSTSYFLIFMAFKAIQMQVMSFDRYYLPMVLPLALVSGLCFSYLRIAPLLLPALVSALAIGGYSALAQQNYMNWNRARWAAIDYAKVHGVPADKIDGGAEYYYLDEIKVVAVVDYENHRQLSFPPGTQGRPPLCDLRYWSVRGDDYVVSHQMFEGHSVVKTFPYWNSLLGKQSNIYLLKRDQESGS
ncbi:MAG: glycosyltransferase family 39 protein [Cyanobacteriota/Melainabacteria group bacterium]